jgi:hypothetical protein
MVASLLIVSGSIAVGLTAAEPPTKRAVKPPGRLLKGTDLFQVTNLFDVHLSFSPDQWAALEPQGGRGFFGGPGPGGPGAGGPRGDRSSGDGFPGDREEPGRPGGFGPGGFGPSMFAAPLFLQGDADRDGQLTAEEFSVLGSRWFTDWDTNKSGILELEKLQAGLNNAMGPPGLVGQGPGDPRAPGGPRGGMRGSPGTMLLGAEGKRNGLASAMGVEFPTAWADLDFAGRAYPLVSVRYKGNGTWMSSRNSLKRSMKVDINDHHPGRNLGDATKLNFHTCVTDPSWMNEVLSHRLFRDAGVPAPRTAYARVHLTVPGEHEHRYVGLYSIVENVDNSFARDRFGTKKGALFKPVTRQLFEDLGNDWAAYKQAYDPKTPVSDEETQRVLALCRLVSHASETEFARRVEEFVDLEAFARFMAVTTWLSTMDSILGVGQNFYVYLHPMTRQFQFIPWDLDHSFGQFLMVGTQEQRENLDIHKPWDGEILFLDRMFKVPRFKQLYLARLREFNQTIFRPERIHAQVDELAAILRPAIEEESEAMAERFDQIVSGRNPEPPAVPGFGGPGGFGQPTRPIKPFVGARAKSVDDQLAGRAQGMRATRGGPFGGFGGGGPGGGGPRGPGGFGPGMILGPAFLSAMDTDQSGGLTAAEFGAAMQAWFAGWDTEPDQRLTETELRAGIDKDLGPSRSRMPGFGPPAGGFTPPP